MRKIGLIIIVHLHVIQCFTQDTSTFHPPLDIPLVLSGNFGELRSDHFHSGIDIKTRGTTGFPVHAIMEGHVSRIKVQANGYGKSIYLAHPNGTTSVYGHLDRYREDIAAYVKQVQYRRKSHQVDIYTDPDLFRISDGELIAYSGNTGGSFGPHLHFEIRTSANQHPVNALKYGFGIRDNIAPRFHSLLIYSGEKQVHALVLDKGKYTVPWGTELTSSGRFGLGVEVFDYLDGAGNRCGVYTLEVYARDQLVYRHVMDEFAFSETRYINAHIDYEENQRHGTKVHRLHRLPNNRLRIYTRLEDDGYLSIGEGETLPVRILATDVAGNQSELWFSITGRSAPTPALKSAPGPVVQRFAWNRDNAFTAGDFRISIPSGALYEDTDFTYEAGPPRWGSLTNIHHVHDAGTPLHRYYSLEVKAPEVDPEIRSKLVFISWDEKEGKVRSPAQASYRNGMVTASLRNFGSFGIGLDTIAPAIEPRNGKVSGNLSGRKSIAFTVTDDLSDIETYEGYVDNQWALFEYDPKNDLLVYHIDPERITEGSVHELELYVTDAQGNVGLFHTTFTW